jgi:cytochrome c oxidase assembly protein subunit 11
MPPRTHKDMKNNRNSKIKQVAVLGFASVMMFGFAFGLVPLYEVFCELTGFGGGRFEQSTLALDTSEGLIGSEAIDREVNIQFLADVGRGLPWEFRPTETQITVKVGEINETQYYARNFANHAVTGQAVPSVTPAFGATSLRKVECFCFTQQLLEAGEEVEMPVLFYVDPDLPADIGTLTLSYSMFPVEMAEVEAEVDGMGHTAANMEHL